MLYSIHQWIYRLYDSTLGNLARRAPAVSLVLLSFIIALLAITAFKYLSNQKAIKLSKNRLLAHLLEIHLFKDDIWSIFRSFRDIVFGTGRYLWHTLKPIAIIILPMVYLLILAEGYYAYTHIDNGDDVLLTLNAEKDIRELINDLEIEASDALTVHQPPFLSIADNQAVWTLSVQKDKRSDIKLNLLIHEQSYSLPLVTDQAGLPVHPTIYSKNSIKRYMHPEQNPLEGLEISSITVDYKTRDISIAGFEWNWLLHIFAISILMGFALKYPFNVNF